MKKLLAVVFAATASALWAMDPIRINFNYEPAWDVDGWRSVTVAEAKEGISFDGGITMKASGGLDIYAGGAINGFNNPLQKVYFDDSWESDKRSVVTFKGLEAGYYKVTIYMAADWGDDYSPISVCGTYYSYANGNLQASKTRWGDVSVKDATVGKNVMEAPVLVGTDGELPIRTFQEGYGRGCICAIEVADYPFAPTPSAISINVANSGLTSGVVEGQNFVSGLAGGDIPGFSWLNVSETANDFQDIAYWDGANHCLVEGETGVGVKVTATGHYSDGSASDVNVFLEYYLDDNSLPKIEVTGIPFKLYDVIVYMNCDWVMRYYYPTSPVANAFNPVTVNGTQYTWDTNTSSVVAGTADWGTNHIAVAALGTNALRIVGLSDPSVVVETGTRSNPARGGFAALQIVAHDYVEVVATGDITTGEVNAKAKGKKEVLLTMPAGATLTIQPKALECDTLFIMSDGNVRIATKNNVEPAEGSVYAANLAKINTASVKGAAFHGWKPTKRIIAFNVMAERGAMPSTWDFNGALGAEEMPSVAWNNLYPSAGTNEVPVVWNGDLLTTNTIDGMTADWSGALYGWGSPEEPFRRGWFDGSQKTGKITVKNIPFEKYDVIVYMNWDGKDYTYGAPWVNGSQWTYDAETNQVVKGDVRWGVTINGAKAELGLNAIRVPNQTDATCEIKTSGSVCNICAVQIVEYCEKPHDPTQSFIFYVK